jgi:type VI secretion system protein ImpE
MLAEQILREGNPEDSLAQLQDQVRRDPANPSYRIFLFQLLAVLGQWERAFTQLKVAGELDAGTLAMVQTYRQALRCEVLRADIFAGRNTPLVFGKPAKWVALMIEALRPRAEGDHAGAQNLRAEAFELAPATSGTIDGQAFEWIADADPRLGPILEVIVNGAYYWVPFDRIREIRVEEPVDLRDLVWMPVQLIWSNGGGTVGLVPTRYPGSESSDDMLVRMARRTEWLEPDAGVYLGLGQRMLTTDADDYPLMDIRRIALDTEGQGEAAEEPGAEEPAAGA